MNRRGLVLSLVGFLSVSLALLACFGLYPGGKDGRALADASWYNSAWLYRQAININPFQISSSTGETYADFPVLISMASDTNLAAFASSTGADILFTKSDGITKLNFQIEQYASSTGQVIAWVNVGSSGLSTSTSTILYMYFGNAAATSSQQDATGTWDSTYAAVYHLPNGTTLSANDATANANNGTIVGGSGGPPTATTGLIDGGASFNGNTNAIDLGSGASLNLTSTITMEAWVNSAVLPSSFSEQVIISKAGTHGTGYHLFYGSDGSGHVDIYAGTTITSTDYAAIYATNAIATSTWYHVAGTYDGTKWTVYLDGVAVATDTTANGPQSTIDDAWLGIPQSTYSSDSWHGIIDEARISNVARSSDWIKTEYNNESNPSGFYSVGQTETQSGLPFVASFSISPNSFAGGGGTSTAAWSTINANSIAITPGVFASSSLSGSTIIDTTSTTIYTLTAMNGNGTSTATTTVTIDTEPPTTPSNLSIATVSSTALSLSWTASTDNVSVAGYNIFRGTTSSSLSQVATSVTNSYTDNSLTPSTTYYYAVSAYDSVGNTSAQSTVASGTTLATGGTIINISSTVDVAGAIPFGINLGTVNNYDSGQIMKNLIGTQNPGFEGQLYQSVVPCATTSGANDCNDGLIYDTWPNNFWAGGTYEMITGQSAGRTGTVSSSATSYPYSSTDFTLSAGSPSIGAGDYMILRKTVNDVVVQPTVNNTSGTPVEGWWISATAGTATTTVDTTDIASSSPGTQALEIEASGTGNSLSLTSYFDSLSGHTFVQLNGDYQLSFKAKGLGGVNAVNVKVGRNSVFLNQDVSLATSTWQTYTYNFTASEDGSQIGSAYVTFDASNTNMLIDDVSLTQTDTDPSNPTVFTDGTVDALKELHPGILRDWSGQLGDSLDNSLEPAFGRKTTHYSHSYGADVIPVGLNDFLQLCQTVGADPWYVIPINWDPQDISNLMQFLAGPTSTTYGAKRAALGQAAPWTSVFPKIYLELGNENWNVGTFDGGVIGDPGSYGVRGGQIFGAAKSSPYYSSSEFQLILGAQYTNSSVATRIVASSSNEDAIGEAPYLAGDVTSSTASNPETLFGQLFAEVENDSHGNGAGGNGTQYNNIQALGSTPVVAYEENLTTDSGSITQAQLDSFVPSLGAGLAVGDEMLMQLRDLGIKYQNVFALTGYDYNTTYDSVSETSPMWGTIIDTNPTIRARPQFLAEELANDAIGTSTNVLVTAQTGDNPTWTQNVDYFGNTISNVTAHYIQAYAFSNGNLVLFNLSRSSSLEVRLAGASLPSGSVTVEQLTSADITDTNESTDTVQIASSTYSNFDPTQTITLPPYSMTDYIQNAPVAPPVITNIAATSVTTNSATISWNTDIDADSTVSYGATTAYGSTAYVASLVTSHGITLSNLDPGATYQFAVTSAASGMSSMSGDNEFTTTAQSSGGGGGGGGGGVTVAASYVTPSAAASTSSSPQTRSSTTSSLQSELNTLEQELAKLQAQAENAAPPSTTRFIFTRNLSYGMTGNDVNQLQLLLIARAVGPAAEKLKRHGSTRTFGILTYNALVEFQKYAGIRPASGYFGPVTRTYVNGL